MGKMKKIRLCIGILAFALMMSMSGCSVSISLGTNKDTEAEKETEEKTEKKTETEEQEEKTAEPTEKPKEITATPTPEAVQEKPVSTPEPEVKEQPVQQKIFTAAAKFGDSKSSPSTNATHSPDAISIIIFLTALIPIFRSFLI